MKSYEVEIKRPLHSVCLDGMMQYMKRRKILILVLLLSVCVITPIFAFQFSPLEQTFAPSGANSTKTYTIVNDSDDSIAVEISALTRDIDTAGREKNENATAYFSIVPSKVILRPQSSQIVRVQYRGPRTVPTELAFRLRAEQIPYSQGRATEGQSMFNFLYVYTTSLYISPARDVVKVQVEQAKPTVTAEGRQVMSLTVSNTGTIHQILNGVKVEVINNQTRQSVVYEGAALGFVNGLNLLAGKTAIVQVAWPQNIQFPTNLKDAEKVFTAKITYEN
ncbi:MAG: fimbria/pilus periplasmic chaperone [Sphaerochaetaceae bacterium]|nr:fimbria/pilus periplasmic chaperone [Sphaerochaetaceae bacterium]